MMKTEKNQVSYLSTLHHSASETNIKKKFYASPINITTSGKHLQAELSLNEKVIKQFSCKFNISGKTSLFAQSGHLYISKSKFCLHRSVFGRKTLEVIPGSNLLSVEPVDGAAVLYYTKTPPPSSEDSSPPAYCSKTTKTIIQFKSEEELNSCINPLRNFLSESYSEHLLEKLELESDSAMIMDELFIHEKTYQFNQTIVKQGSLCNDVFQIISGTCSVIIDNYRVKELEAGEIFGELSFILGTVTTATVCVTSPSAVIANCSWQTICSVAANEPQQALAFYQFLARSLCSRFIETEKKLALFDEIKKK